MIQRLAYIDSLKGIAILLMVMGHVIAYQFSGFYSVYSSSPRSALLVWRIIYSFHMPLFAFCSGLFVIKETPFSLKEGWNIILKRIKSLILPSIFAGGVLWLQRGSFGYWYLWILFQFVVVTLILDYLCGFSKKYRNHFLTTLMILSSIAVMLFLSKLRRFQNMPLIDIEHWNIFPYFALGVISSQYNLIKKYGGKNWIYSVSLLVFGFLTYWITMEGNHIPKQSLTGCLLPISAIVALIYFCQARLNDKSKVARCFQWLGRHSLEIYILHLFFLFQLFPVGDYVLSIANTGGGGRTIFFVQAITSFIASVMIIALCAIVMSIISRSNLLSVLFLGRKSKNHELQNLQ